MITIIASTILIKQLIVLSTLICCLIQYNIYRDNKFYKYKLIVLYDTINFTGVVIPITRYNLLYKDPKFVLQRYDSNGKPLKAAVVKPTESKKPDKKFGGNKSMAFMQTMFEAYVKANKKANKSKKRKKCNNDSSDSSNSE
jgi:hypothetical protein